MSSIQSFSPRYTSIYINRLLTWNNVKSGVIHNVIFGFSPCQPSNQMQQVLFNMNSHSSHKLFKCYVLDTNISIHINLSVAHILCLPFQGFYCAAGEYIPKCWKIWVEMPNAISTITSLNQRHKTKKYQQMWLLL